MPYRLEKVRTVRLSKTTLGLRRDDIKTFAIKAGIMNINPK